MPKKSKTPVVSDMWFPCQTFVYSQLSDESVINRTNIIHIKFINASTNIYVKLEDSDAKKRDFIIIFC